MLLFPARLAGMRRFCDGGFASTRFYAENSTQSFEALGPFTPDMIPVACFVLSGVSLSVASNENNM
ncbi:hypothetical protein LY56_01448 [Roseinatronobacter thiooxidans]|uniref:Uncharacterized protein n=1 Tax=Roseinatronobacter thiooxidans TaxID=121821 RepID=A0A2W7R5F7_9RHOB|nr:hypothetical protein LY56_01448 [Roseinatronobacter thiooxidans]